MLYRVWLDIYNERCMGVSQWLDIHLLSLILVKCIQLPDSFGDSLVYTYTLWFIETSKKSKGFLFAAVFIKGLYVF